MTFLTNHCWGRHGHDLTTAKTEQDVRCLHSQSSLRTLPVLPQCSSWPRHPAPPLRGRWSLSLRQNFYSLIIWSHSWGLFYNLTSFNYAWLCFRHCISSWQHWSLISLSINIMRICWCCKCIRITFVHNPFLLPKYPILLSTIGFYDIIKFSWFSALTTGS